MKTTYTWYLHLNRYDERLWHADDEIICLRRHFFFSFFIFFLSLNIRRASTTLQIYFGLTTRNCSGNEEVVRMYEDEECEFIDGLGLAISNECKLQSLLTLHLLSSQIASGKCVLPSHFGRLTWFHDFICERVSVTSSSITDICKPSTKSFITPKCISIDLIYAHENQQQNRRTTKSGSTIYLSIRLKYPDERSF